MTLRSVLLFLIFLAVQGFILHSSAVSISRNQFRILKNEIEDHYLWQHDVIIYQISDALSEEQMLFLKKSVERLISNDRYLKSYILKDRENQTVLSLGSDPGEVENPRVFTREIRKNSDLIGVSQMVISEYGLLEMAGAVRKVVYASVLSIFLFETFIFLLFYFFQLYYPLKKLGKLFGGDRIPESSEISAAGFSYSWKRLGLSLQRKLEKIEMDKTAIELLNPVTSIPSYCLTSEKFKLISPEGKSLFFLFFSGISLLSDGHGLKKCSLVCRDIFVEIMIKVKGLDPASFCGHLAEDSLLIMAESAKTDDICEKITTIVKNVSISCENEFNLKKGWMKVSVLVYPLDKEKPLEYYEKISREHLIRFKKSFRKNTALKVCGNSETLVYET